MTPENAAQKYHWIQYNPKDQLIEMFCDNHMLNTLEQCEMKFFTEHLLNVRPIGHKSWSLSFGAYLHYCFEVYYRFLRDNEGKNMPIDDFLKYGKEKWYELKLDGYSEDKKYKTLGGLDGALNLLTMYWAYYHDLRVRVVDVEIAFGKNREVLLGEFYLPIELGNNPVRCYLTGRIDLIVDNGNKIGPVDHKHHAVFRGDEYKKFNPHDGVTGYILAVNSVMSQLYPKYFEQGRQCLSSWVYHISAAFRTDRFKVTPIDKVPEQLEEYKARKVEEFKRIADIIFNGASPRWNTNACSNIYNRECEYKVLHEAPSKEWPNLIKSHYNITEAWNPDKPEESTINRDKVIISI